MSTITTPTFDAAALRRAFHTKDAEELAALYAEDATVEIVDALNPPSSPQRHEGRAAVRAHLEDILGRDMSHALDLVAVGDDSLGYSVRCEYPDGTRVVCVATAQLRDGKIVRELGVQAWDGGS
jgi:ketosteroid isomerase-like protein